MRALQVLQVPHVLLLVVPHAHRRQSADSGLVVLLLLLPAAVQRYGDLIWLLIQDSRFL